MATPIDECSRAIDRAQRFAPEAVDHLIEIADDDDNPARDRVEACRLLLNYAFGFNQE
jgi:hypothetical protein